MSGNTRSFDAVYGRMDASVGLLLKGDGKGSFKPQPAEKSGLFLGGECKGLAMLFDNRRNEIFLAPTYADSMIVLGYERQKKGRIFFAGALDAFAVIEYKDGHKRKQEFYYGNGYFSQLAGGIKISDMIRSIQVVDCRGGKRTI